MSSPAPVLSRECDNGTHRACELDACACPCHEHRSWDHETHELAPGIFASRYRNGRLEHYELVDDRDHQGAALIIDLTTDEMIALGARLWEWIGSSFADDRARVRAWLDAERGSAPAVDHPPESAP